MGKLKKQKQYSQQPQALDPHQEYLLTIEKKKQALEKEFTQLEERNYQEKRRKEIRIETNIVNDFDFLSELNYWKKQNQSKQQSLNSTQDQWDSIMLSQSESQSLYRSTVTTQNLNLFAQSFYRSQGSEYFEMKSNYIKEDIITRLNNLKAQIDQVEATITKDMAISDNYQNEIRKYQEENLITKKLMNDGFYLNRIADNAFESTYEINKVSQQKEKISKIKMKKVEEQFISTKVTSEKLIKSLKSDLSTLKQSAVENEDYIVKGIYEFDQTEKQKKETQIQIRKMDIHNQKQIDGIYFLRYHSLEMIGFYNVIHKLFFQQQIQDNQIQKIIEEEININYDLDEAQQVIDIFLDSNQSLNQKTEIIINLFQELNKMYYSNVTNYYDNLDQKNARIIELENITKDLQMIAVGNQQLKIMTYEQLYKEDTKSSKNSGVINFTDNLADFTTTNVLQHDIQSYLEKNKTYQEQITINKNILFSIVFSAINVILRPCNYFTKIFKYEYNPIKSFVAQVQKIQIQFQFVNDQELICFDYQNQEHQGKSKLSKYEQVIQIFMNVFGAEFKEEAEKYANVLRMDKIILLMYPIDELDEYLVKMRQIYGVRSSLKQCFRDTNQILDRALDLLLQKINEVLFEYKEFILQVETVLESKIIDIQRTLPEYELLPSNPYDEFTQYVQDAQYHQIDRLHSFQNWEHVEPCFSYNQDKPVEKVEVQYDDKQRAALVTMLNQKKKPLFVKQKRMYPVKQKTKLQETEESFLLQDRTKIKEKVEQLVDKNETLVHDQNKMKVKRRDIYAENKEYQDNKGLLGKIVKMETTSTHLNNVRSAYLTINKYNRSVQLQSSEQFKTISYNYFKTTNATECFQRDSRDYMKQSKISNQMKIYMDEIERNRSEKFIRYSQKNLSKSISQRLDSFDHRYNRVQTAGDKQSQSSNKYDEYSKTQNKFFKNFAFKAPKENLHKSLSSFKNQEKFSNFPYFQ